MHQTDSPRGEPVTCTTPRGEPVTCTTPRAFPWKKICGGIAIHTYILSERWSLLIAIFSGDRNISINADVHSAVKLSLFIFPSIVNSNKDSNASHSPQREVGFWTVNSDNKQKECLFGMAAKHSAKLCLGSGFNTPFREWSYRAIGHAFSLIFDRHVLMVFHSNILLPFGKSCASEGVITISQMMKSFTRVGNNHGYPQR